MSERPPPPRFAAAPLAALTALFVLGGCITHLPVRTRDHLSLRWARDFDAAVDEAQRTGRPVLACLIAGQIDGPC